MQSASKSTATAARRARQHRIATTARSRKPLLLAAAVLSAVGASAANSAFAQNVYWDINGTAPGSGATAGDASGTWDGVATVWNSDPTGGAGGALTADIGAGNTGVFAAGADATGTYTVTIPDAQTRTAGGFTLNQGTVTIVGLGNGGLTPGTAPSYVNVGTGTFNVNVAANSTLNFGLSSKLPSLTGSATIVKTGPGIFNNAGANNITGNQFTGKWVVNEGTLGLFYGSTDNMLGPQPNPFRSDQITISNNAVIKTYQNQTSRPFGVNRGITIGAGGATFFSAGSADFDGVVAPSLGSLQFTGRITGGTEANRVPITFKSNVLTGVATIGQTSGTTYFSFVDNSVSTTAPALYAKWIVKGGELGPARAGTTADTALGVIPPSYLADAITLDSEDSPSAPGIPRMAYLRPNANFTIHANRGITLGANGGGLHPANTVGTAIIFNVDSIITGAGQLRVYLDQAGGTKVILNGANNYTGGTLITAVGGNNAEGTLQVNTNTLPAAGGVVISNNGTLNFDQTFIGSYAGNISNGSVGNGKLLKSNSGVVVLSGTNTYAGQTTATGGALVAATTAALPGYTSGGNLISSGGGIIAGSAGGAGQWSSADIDTLSNNINYSGGTGAFGINVDTGNTFTYATNIAVNGGFGKVGPGELTLTGTNTYTGGTSILGGILNVASTNISPSSASLTFANGGTIKLLSNFNPDNGGTRSITMNAGGGVIDTNGFNIPDSQTPITGAGSFTKAGGGTLVSGQLNSYAGGTILKGGTYEIINDANLGAAAGPITFDGGTLKYRTDFATGRAITLAAGGGTLATNNHNLDASGSSVDGTGSFTINGGGSFKTTHIRTTGNLTVNSATLIFPANGVAPGVSKVGALSVASKIDLSNNHLITTSAVGSATAGVYDGVSGLIQSGRNGGGWGGQGIVTSQTDATTSNFTSIGIASGSQVKGIAASATAVWAGQTVSGSDTLVMYTYGGDANLDGKINVDDYGHIDSSIPIGLAGWYNGDFNYDGKINVDDYGIIDFNIGIQGAPFFTAGGVAEGQSLAAVPEPAAFGLFSVGGLGWLLRRRRAAR